jgi:hypothetical protein
MATKAEKIAQIQKELKLFTETLARYKKQFSADGTVDIREQAQLERMNGAIGRINARLSKITGIAPTPVPTPTPEEETAENPISANPLAMTGDRNVFVYKDVTELHYNKITELYKTGSVGAVDENTGIHWNDVSQGGVGDCYFLSAIGAVAKADPSLLKKLIKGPFKDGSYEVTLHIKEDKFFDFLEKRTPHKVTITSEFLVDGNGAPIYAGSGDSELWVMLLEKAYALLRGKEQTDMSHHGKSYDSLEAGWGEEGIEVLTGKEASMLWVPNMSIQEITTQISTALADRRPIATGTIEGPAQGVKANAAQAAAAKANLVFLHEYFVLAFDGSKITLQNPWNAEQVDGDGRGDITISIADYKRWFRDLCIQDK